MMRRQQTPSRPRSGPTRRHVSLRRSRRRPQSVGILLIAGLSVAAAGCGGSSKPATTAAPAATPSSVSTPTTSAPASTPAATTSALTGTWSGQYSGAYQGTFTLTWQQSGSNLSGTIKLSTPPSTLSIHGTLNGSAISFGTVGSLAVTYTGTVSGSSMSGTYQVNGSNGGNWSATKA